MIRFFLLFVALLVATPALAQTYPRLSGRVVDAADLLNPAQEAELTRKLEALQRASSRQLVVATIANLEGRSIEEYGVGLGRAWGIGQRQANNGVVLIVAPNEKKVRIEVGYGLEGILTDALSSRIIREKITPRFRERDYAGGINAGADAIIAQLQAPPEAAERQVAAAAQAESGHRQRRGGGSLFPILIWGGVLLFILLPLLGSGLRGRRYRGGPWGRRGRVSTWGPGSGRDGSGLGWMLAGMVLGSMSRGRHGGGWGGGGSWGGGGGGGFSGGGGSFGGGGASGGW